MIDMIKENHPEITEVSANDYIVGNTTSFRNIYGLEYPIPETSQYWDVKEPKATECTEELNSELYNILSYKEYIHYYQNPSAGNNLKILLVNDSFIRMYIKDDFAEKFSDTLSIHWDNIPNLDEIVSLYNPDIIILESADISSALGNVVNYVNKYE